jgi:hypothetical protein
MRSFWSSSCVSLERMVRYEAMNRRRRIPCKQTSERLGCAMLTVGSTTWRRWRGVWRGEGGEKRRRRRREEARARLIYGAAASYSRAGGGIDRQRRNCAAAARGGGERGNGGRGRAREEGNFSRCVFARVRRDAARCSRRLTFGARIVQTAARPKKFAAPPRIARLLEGRFRALPRIFPTGGAKLERVRER